MKAVPTVFQASGDVPLRFPPGITSTMRLVESPLAPATEYIFSHPVQISDFGFRISNFRKHLGKRPAFTGGAWHPDSPRIGVPGILSRQLLPGAQARARAAGSSHLAISRADKSEIRNPKFRAGGGVSRGP